MFRYLEKAGQQFIRGEWSRGKTVEPIAAQILSDGYYGGTRAGAKEANWPVQVNPDAPTALRLAVPTSYSGSVLRLRVSD